MWTLNHLVEGWNKVSDGTAAGSGWISSRGSGKAAAV